MTPTHNLRHATSTRHIALVGNPNCGKTTLFNALTGSNYKVANYPGATVEKREGRIHLSDEVSASLIDLPGTYSLRGTTPDEQIVTKLFNSEIRDIPRPDLVVAVVDASNLERNLYLISELIDTETPVVIALNMMDAAAQQGITIYVDLLARLLDVSIVPIVARSKKGLEDLHNAIAQRLKDPITSRRAFAWATPDDPRAASLRALCADSSRVTLDAATIAAVGTLRYAWIRSIVARTQITSHSIQPQHHRLDALFTSKVWGLPILAALFAFVFQAIFLWAQLPMELIGGVVDGLSRWISYTLPPGILTSLLAEGIIPGVGNVIVFIPQIAILFFFIGILEDSGYLSRAAFLLDNFMRKVGLQGRAFIPLLSSFACAVPGILSTRTIPTRADRLTTIMIAPLMSCSARLPVYAVLIAAAVPPVLIGGYISLQGLVLLGMYLLGVCGACIVATILHKLLRKKESCFFVMEMPPLRRPVLRVVLRGVYDSVASFVKNATTIILACSVIIWFLASYPKPAPEYTGNPVQVSFAGRLGSAIEPLIKPLGFNWEIGFSIIASFPAREVFVTGLSTVLNVSSDDEEHRGLVQRLQEKERDGSFSMLTAISLMVFYVFACQCMSTLAVCHRETGSWRWTFGMFAYMTSLAYAAALITYQLGKALM